jgi:hypothetical protein
VALRSLTRVRHPACASLRKRRQALERAGDRSGRARGRQCGASGHHHVIARRRRDGVCGRRRIT